MSQAGTSRDDAVLVLEDGSVHRGEAFGARGRTLGEAVFATGMTGYQETLTDPSYHRQIVVATAPHIGNTGWNDEDDESARIQVAGYVVRDPARRPSNWRSTADLGEELARQGVVGLAGRRHPRDHPPAARGGLDARRPVLRRRAGRPHLDARRGAATAPGWPAPTSPAR